MRHVTDEIEGYVTEVLRDSFWARFTDIDGILYEANFITSKVLKDTTYLQSGIPFYCTTFNDGTFDFTLIVEFWTEDDIAEIKVQATEIRKKLNALPQLHTPN